MARPIFIPISGRDRRFALRELEAARRTYKRQMPAALAAQRAAAELQSEADRMFCEAWHAAAFAGETIQPSPTVAQALNAGFNLLDVRCSQCERTEAIDLGKLEVDQKRPLWALEASFNCYPCRQKSGRRTAAYIVGLRCEEPPPGQPPASAASRGG